MNLNPTRAHIVGCRLLRACGAAAAAWLCGCYWPAADVLAQEQTDVPSELLTVAETSEFKATSSSAEVVAMLEVLAQRAAHIELHEFGRTVEDRSMTAAIGRQPTVPAWR